MGTEQEESEEEKTQRNTAGSRKERWRKYGASGASAGIEWEG